MTWPLPSRTCPHNRYVPAASKWTCTGRSGLYFVGLPWQHSRGSALLGFVRDDTAYLADRAPDRQPAARPASQQPG
ncbi:MAG TPA: hypothetical protein VFO01_17330 [Trebonia sp.]|nr:hypothetical protein [Trebonia sp.]